jgi:hypothetical protein
VPLPRMLRRMLDMPREPHAGVSYSVLGTEPPWRMPPRIRRRSGTGCGDADSNLHPGVSAASRPLATSGLSYVERWVWLRGRLSSDPPQVPISKPANDVRPSVCR